MRKIAILLGFFALAFCGWRVDAIEYNFALTLDDIPKEYTKLGDDAIYYLVNKDTHEVYMYVSSSDWGGAFPSTTSPEIGMKGDGLNHSDTEQTFVIGGQEYKNVAHTVGTSSLINGTATKEGDYKKVWFNHALISNVDIDKMDYTTIGKTVYIDNLAVIIDDTKNTDYGSYYQEFAVAFQTIPGSNAGQLTAYGVFNAPEPTSGVLLLLGMAGLALRRRKAA